MDTFEYVKCNRNCFIEKLLKFKHAKMSEILDILYFIPDIVMYSLLSKTETEIRKFEILHVTHNSYKDEALFTDW